MPTGQRPQRRVQKTRQSSRRQPNQSSHKTNTDQALPNTTVRKKGNVYYLFYSTKRQIPWRVIIAMIVVFIGAIGSAYSYAQIHNIQQEIETSRQDLINQTTANRNMEAQITRSYTREEIEYHASVRLGMGPPDPSQIIYFYVPHHSGVIMSTYAPQTIAVETGFWQGIVDFFSGIRQRLFD